MKLNVNPASNAEMYGDIQSNKVSINTKHLDYITQILTSNLYSSPLQSFIRETLSNAQDSHIEAKTTKPIILDIGYDPKFYIRIQDFGTGLSEERFNSIYKYLGASTKRDSNDYIGAFGFGRLSCLAVADSAIITNTYNHEEFKYLMYKDGLTIKIDTISQTITQNDNGLEVLVYPDIDEYQAKNTLCTIIPDLVFYNNLYISTQNLNHGYLSVNLRLKELVCEFNKRTIYSEDNYFTASNWDRLKDCIRIKYGSVIYPINFNNVKSIPDWLKEIKLCIDIPIGELDVTPNREELLYSQKTINTVNKYIDDYIDYVGKKVTEKFTYHLDTKEKVIAFIKQDKVVYFKDSKARWIVPTREATKYIKVYPDKNSVALSEDETGVLLDFILPCFIFHVSAIKPKYSNRCSTRTDDISIVNYIVRYETGDTTTWRKVANLNAEAKEYFRSIDYHHQANLITYSRKTIASAVYRRCTPKDTDLTKEQLKRLIKLAINMFELYVNSIPVYVNPEHVKVAKTVEDKSALDTFPKEILSSSTKRFSDYSLSELSKRHQYTHIYFSNLTEALSSCILNLDLNNLIVGSQDTLKPIKLLLLSSKQYKYVTEYPKEFPSFVNIVDFVTKENEYIQRLKGITLFTTKLDNTYKSYPLLSNFIITSIPYQIRKAVDKVKSFTNQDWLNGVLNNVKTPTFTWGGATSATLGDILCTKDAGHLILKICDYIENRFTINVSDILRCIIFGTLDTYNDSYGAMKVFNFIKSEYNKDKCETLLKHLNS